MFPYPPELGHRATVASDTGALIFDKQLQIPSATGNHHEIYNVQTQIHNEFLEASNYLKTIITYLKSCSRAGKVDDKIGDFIDKMPEFNYIGGNRVITCINQLCSREIGISEAIIRIQEVERSINAALRTV